MWLAAYINLFQFGYRCSGGATSVNFPVKFTMASLLLVWYWDFSGTCICGAICSTLRFGGFYFPPSELMGFLQPPSELVESIIIHSEKDYLDVAVESLVVVLHIWNFLVVFLWQLVQVLQIWMVMIVLCFIGHGSIAVLQSLLVLLMIFWACQNCEERSQMCMKLFWLWCLPCKIWIIYSVALLLQFTIHIIHEDHMLLSLQTCCGTGLLFLVVQMVCD